MEKSSKGQSSENLAARSIGLIHNLANNFTRDTKNHVMSGHVTNCKVTFKNCSELNTYL